MKDFKLLLPVVVATLTFLSCSTESSLEIPAELRDAKINAAKAFVSKVQFKLQVKPVDGQALRKTFRVSPSDIQSLLAANSNLSTRSMLVRSVEPIIYNGDTIMYLVNYAKGWKLFSVDKRMPAILAENYVETGKKVADILNNESIAFWIENVAGQTKYLSQTDEYDENSENLAVWASNNRGIQRIPYQPVPGEYIYVGREEVSRKSSFVPHVTKTLWHQSSPFNAYCPLVSTDSQQRCVVGCVAVATAQYMYYLQDKRGYSFVMPQSGSCTGVYNGSYVQNFSRMSTWNLNGLALTDNTSKYSSASLDQTALALGYVGKGVNVTYGVQGSSAAPIASQIFLNKNGVKGKFVELGNISISLIVDGSKEPVIASGSKSDGSRHMFLIDGCKYDSVVYEDVWRFLEDTTFYDPDRYGVILREQVVSKQNYLYQCNLGANFSSLPYISDADDTYYRLDNIAGYCKDFIYFKREK